MMPLQPEPLFRKTTMSAQCTDHCHTPTASADPRYRRILWIALLVNAAMFVVELGAGLSSGSASLLADAIAAEQYERAARLRDEIARRRGGIHYPPA